MKAVNDYAQFFAPHPLTRDAQGAAWLRILRWQVRSRLQTNITFDWIAGQKLVVHRGMTGATGNIYAGLHEFPDMALLLHFLRPGDLFLDIGANVGSYTVLASGVCRARTWAFEPDPTTVLSLERNVRINALDGLVTVQPMALADFDGKVPFTTGRDTTNQVAAAGTVSATQSVPARRLDSLIEGHHPAMIKLDVEGYEAAVLKGALRTLADPTLRVIEIETVTEETSALLQRNGFQRAYYDPTRRALQTTPCDLAASNALFVRDGQGVQARLTAAPAIEVLGKSI